MEEKIIVCKDCGEFIGVETKSGMMIGNIVFDSFSAVCAICENPLAYQLEFVKESYLSGMIIKVE